MLNAFWELLRGLPSAWTAKSGWFVFVRECDVWAYPHADGLFRGAQSTRLLELVRDIAERLQIPSDYRSDLDELNRDVKPEQAAVGCREQVRRA